MKRPVILAVPLALVLAVTLGACGDDDDDDSPTTLNTSPEVSITASDVPDGDSSPAFTIPDSLPEDASAAVAQIFPNLDDDQVQCLVDNLGGEFDPTQVMSLLSECSIELTDLQPAG